MDKDISHLVIVGGGTAGWIAAAACAKLLGDTLKITLVESDTIGTVGVGEATIPQIRRLNSILGIDEDDFVAKTNGSFKLGIEFRNWGALGDRYLHTFGDIGLNLSGRQFHQYWLRHHLSGGDQDLWSFSLHEAAAKANKFARMDKVGRTAMTGLSYAFHFDAALYAQYLRAIAENLGVERHEGIVTRVDVDSETGSINALALDAGLEISGDFFIDCTGFRSLLLGEALDVAYEDWSSVLPCNRAIAAPCASAAKLTPFTRATAHGAGWQWRIPLQHRTGNGHVFCADFMDEADAERILVDNLDGDLLADPRVIRFQTGRRSVFWKNNCVALGLASGFLEPLESTSIHLVQSNVSRLIQLFPRRGLHPQDIWEYNRLTIQEFESVRDFLVLHYKATQRTDTEFWNYCRTMPVPDSVREKIDLFRASGRIYHNPDDLFRDISWVQVMVGQGLVPGDYSPLVGGLSDDDLAEFLKNVRKIVQNAVDPLPDHADFIAQNCFAATPEHRNHAAAQ